MVDQPWGDLFGTLERETLSMKIAKRILSLIKEKQLRPGDRLPSERELARMMQVSRPSLREALRALQIMNIIENRQGSGNYITSLEPKKLIEHLEAVFVLDDAVYVDLFKARKIMETGLAELAAGNITDSEVEELEALVKEAKERVDDAEAFLHLDLALHNQIVKAARNGILELFMSSINQLSVYSRRRTAESPDIRRQTVRDHRAIVRALKSHDPAAARAAMFRHLSRVEKGFGDQA
ncbi:MAG: FadR family transcriptional regulator [Actinobacteria bacterium]|jgi:GntR family transcriptional repressor for pyruvate dehydrogenase complex|nr:MAG: FadR family transcriptional regulator [Actinomycetota bacterium]